MSRGRGIRCYNSLPKILDTLHNYQGPFVIQKYIENPMLILNKKFDIRIWVLLRKLQPLQIFVFQEYYLRFSSVDYSLDDISNRLIHLTNNAI